MFMCISSNRENTYGSKSGSHHNKNMDLSRALLVPFAPLSVGQGEQLPPSSGIAGFKQGT